MNLFLTVFYISAFIWSYVAVAFLHGVINLV